MNRQGDPRNILVRAPNWIGDQVMAYPFFYYLRAAFPDARIGAVCMPWVSSIQYRNLVDEIYILKRPDGRSFVQKLKTTERSCDRLKEKGPWDLGISLPNSLSAAWVLFRSGCAQRRGYPGDLRSWLLNDRVTESSKGTITHRADSYLSLLAGLLSGAARPDRGANRFWGVSPQNDLDSGIPGVVSEFPGAAAWVPGLGEAFLQPPGGDYWILAPGSAADARRWPVEKFAALARLIIQETGLPALVVGGPSEAPLGKILSEIPNVLDRTAQGAVSNYWPLFRNARFAIANDSGLAHVSAICGCRTHVIWGAGDPRRTAPIGPAKVTLTLNPVDCWPCERNVCSKEGSMKNLCLQQISPEQVWADLKRGSGAREDKESDAGLQS